MFGTQLKLIINYVSICYYKKQHCNIRIIMSVLFFYLFSSCSDGSPKPPACDPDLDDDAYTKCSELFGDAFKECHWFVPPQIYVSSCVSDYCISQGDKEQLCTSLEDYVSACEITEVFLPDWRNHTFCCKCIVFYYHKMIF